MVRKRNKRKSRGKNYDSEESEEEIRVPESEEPVQKTYSLRKRSRPNFTEDFEYELDDEECLEGLEAEDEEFVLEEDSSKNLGLIVTNVEPDETNVESVANDETTADELIDFEDMIRADIVVNTNRIDYDNLIQKSEIKVMPIGHTGPYVDNRTILQKKRDKPIPWKRRGRKPMSQKSLDNGHSIFQDLLVPMIKSTTNEDYDSSDDLPLSVAFKSKTEKPQLDVQNDNEAATDTNDSPVTPQNTDSIVVAQITDAAVAAPITDAAVAALNTDLPVVAPTTESTVPTEAETKKPPDEEKPAETNRDLYTFKLPQIHSVESIGSEDDVVFIEESPQVIVLDD